MTDFQVITMTVTIVALTLNFCALLFAGYQALLTRKALEAAKEGIEHARRSRHLEFLPQAGWIIQVRVSLEQWQEGLNKAIELLEEALRKKDGATLREISERTRESPKGLADRFVYEHAPDWLGNILMAGARHYYDAVASMIYLWSQEKNESNFGLAEMLLPRCKASATYISSLIEYLNDLVPEPYLQASASLGDEDYLRDRPKPVYPDRVGSS